MQLANILSSYGHFSLKVDFINSVEQIKASLKLKAYAPIIIDEEQRMLRSGEKVHEKDIKPFGNLAVSNYINPQKLYEIKEVESHERRVRNRAFSDQIGILKGQL